jgi:hypothetical protein
LRSSSSGLDDGLADGLAEGLSLGPLPDGPVRTAPDSRVADGDGDAPSSSGVPPVANVAPARTSRPPMARATPRAEAFRFTYSISQHVSTGPIECGPHLYRDTDGAKGFS